MDDNPQVPSVGRATSEHAGHAHMRAAPDTLGPRLLAGVFINLAGSPTLRSLNSARQVRPLRRWSFAQRTWTSRSSTRHETGTST
jgi:hypothetical protein